MVWLVVCFCVCVCVCVCACSALFVWLSTCSLLCCVVGRKAQSECIEELFLFDPRELLDATFRSKARGTPFRQIRLALPQIPGDGSDPLAEHAYKQPGERLLALGASCQDCICIGTSES